ncbi:MULTISPECIES: ComF family protein [unclassified Streptomyces]|uniref:ComF family protein n=1 Tax=unclassified Streptomyces TaxID=2593676 RepID=UPI001316A3C0|nr:MULTISPECIES: ComF family protein [unclassified Streptomyces]QHC29759.1 ComF family protein [Streptomyces sp. HF10]WKE71389.1 ComF family protein [Streptomyces sp. WP-1]
MRGWWRDLTDLVLPTDCAGCGAPRTTLCARCRTALAGSAPRRVRPQPEPPGLPAVYASAAYAEAVRALLLAHKERGALTLTGALGAALARAVRAGLDAAAGAGTSGTVVLVPVPSARWAVRARGHDPVRRMALAAAGELRRTGTPARVAAVLRQRRPVADQAGLDARRRLANLAGALEVAAGGDRLLAGGRVVLVDDLVTTGASLAEAARALRIGERRVVYENATREVREERSTGGPQKAKRENGKWVHGAAKKTPVNALDPPLRAAVIAAPVDSFEINRN